MSKRDQLVSKLKSVLKDDYDEQEVNKEILSKYDENPMEYTPEQISSYLLEYIDKRSVEKMLNELEDQEFWATDPITYQTEQNLENNYQEDYGKIPVPQKAKKELQPKKDKPVAEKEVNQEYQQPVEKLLLKCLILALLFEHDKGVITPKGEEFKKASSIAEVKKEVEALRQAIENEGRTTTKIAKFLDQAINFQPSKQKTSGSIYDNLSAIKKELIVIDVPDLERLIAKTTEVEKEIESKNIILFIGETGSGKTTTIKALLGYKMGKKKFKGMSYVTIAEKVTDKKVLDMHSNPSCKSVTRYIVAVKPKVEMKAGEVYLADTPGWGDTAGVEVQLANIIGVRRALRSCRTVIPVIVISKESWGTRGIGIRNLGMTIATLFQDYGAIKNSVAIVMNRYSQEEMDEMDRKIGDIMSEMDSSERANENYLSFFQHLQQLATNDELLTFDPLKDSPQELLKVLLKKGTQKPNSIFQNTLPSANLIKSYCSDTAKRIRYHLKKNNPQLVKYFIGNMENLKLILYDDSIENELNSIRKEIETVVRDDYRRITEDFNFKVKTFSVTKKDVKSYFGDVKILAIEKGYNQIVDLDLVREAETYFQGIFKELAKDFTVEQKKDPDPSRSRNLSATIKVLYEARSAEPIINQHFRDIKASVQESIKLESAAYYEALKDSEYEKAVTHYEKAMQYLGLKAILTTTEEKQGVAVEESKESQEIRKSIPSHIYKLIEDGKSCFGRTLKINVNMLAEVDKRLCLISNCFRLVNCLDASQREKIPKAIKDFTDELRGMSMKHHGFLVTVIDKARNEPIKPTALGQFEQHFDILGEISRKIESIQSLAESQLENVNMLLTSFIESQRGILQKSSEEIRNPEQLKTKIEYIQTALKGIEGLSQFGNEELKSSSKRLLEDTISQLNSTLPNIFAGLSGRNNLKFNSSECESTFNKFCEAKDMEEVFSRLENFRDEHDKLRILNQKNERILTDALNDAKKCIEMLTQPRASEETQGRLESQYTNISLNNIEMALRFMDTVSQKSPFEGPRKETLSILEIARVSLTELHEYYLRAIHSFAGMIQDADKQPQPSQLNSSNNRQKRQLIGDRCREIWRWARRIFQQVKDIESKHHSVNALGNFFVPQLIEEFNREASQLYDRLLAEWNSIKDRSGKLDELNILMKKCETFKDSDKEVIGSKAEDFVKLRSDVAAKLEGRDSRVITRVQRLIDGRNFYALKLHIQKLRQDNEDHVTYEEAKDKLEEFSTTFLKEKREKMVEIRKGNPSIEDISTYSEIQEEFQNFLECYEHKEIRRLKQEFEERISVLKPKLNNDLEDCLARDEIGEAYVYLRQMEAIERNLSGKGIEAKGLSKGFQDRINEKLKGIEQNIQEERNYPYLKSFFERNLKNQSNKTIVQLKSEWDERVMKKFRTLVEEMERSELKEKMDSLRKQAADLIEFMSTGNRTEKEKFLDEKYKLSFSMIERNKEKLSKKTEQLKEITKLEFESVRPILEYLTKEKNGEIENELTKSLKTIWERKKQEATKKSLSANGYIQMYLKEINPFSLACNRQFSKVGNVGVLVGSIANTLRLDFEELFYARLDWQITEINRLLSPNEKITPQQTVNWGNQAVEHIEDIFRCVAAIDQDAHLKPIQPQMSKKYSGLMGSIVSNYENLTKNINVKTMFSGRLDRDAFQKFEAIMRQGRLINRISKQITEKKPSRIGGADESLGFSTKVQDLVALQGTLTEFVQRMEECSDFLKGFDINKIQFNNSNERVGELQQFYNHVNNADSYMRIYEHFGRPRFDTNTSRKKLEESIRSISEQTVKIIANLASDYEDRTLRKLDQNCLVLACFERVTPEFKYGSQAKQEAEDLIKKESIFCEDLLIQAKIVAKNYDKVEQDLKKEKTDKIGDEHVIIQNAHNEKVNKLTEDHDTKINLQTDEKQKEKLAKTKQTEIDLEVKNLNNAKSEYMLTVEQQYAKRFKDAEKERNELIAKLSKRLAWLKQIQINAVIVKNECQATIGRVIGKIAEEGKRFTNLMAKGLEEFGTNYSLLIIKENPKVFSSYMNKQFKRATASANFQYVADTIKGLLSNVESTHLKEKYKKFKDHYDVFTGDYSKTPTQSCINNLKSIITTKAHEVAKDYERGQPTKGLELLAEIFALWTIKRATVSDEEGVEFIYEPHPAQIMAMFLILGICGDKKEQLGNRMVQILTGEGKSVVLGGLSCYLAVAGFDVFCMCYSRLLSRRDYEDSVDMFRELGIEDFVHYGTFGEVTEKLFNSKKRDLRSDVKEILSSNKNCSDDGLKKSDRKRILLVDEVDVFFAKEYFGQLYTPSAIIEDPLISSLASYVWKNRQEVTYLKLKETEEFKSCLAKFPRLQAILTSNAADMVSSVKNFNHSYIIKDDKICYALPEGISDKANFGWKTTFAYYYESQRNLIKSDPQKHASVSVLCCEMSYAELPREFSYIMGVTGTLEVLSDNQTKVLKDWYQVTNFYYIPSVYSKSIRERLGLKVATKENHFTEICNAIQAQVNQKKPVVVFCPTIDMLNSLYQSKEFQGLKDNTIAITVKDTLEITKKNIIRATRARTISLMTREFGRGIDFVVDEKEVKQAGGLHIIQTFISRDKAEAVQIEGRTARQGSRGSCEIIVDEDQLSTYGLTVRDLEGKSVGTVEKTIDEFRNRIFEAECAEQVKRAVQCKPKHETAKQILNNIRSGKNDKVIEEVNRLNYIEPPVVGKTVRTVIGIDGTGSMAKVLGQVLDNMKTCLERTYQILKEKKIPSGFEIQVAIYRNYNSDASKLFQVSPFSNNADDLVNFLKGVQAEGGLGNEAVQNLYNHVLNFEKEVDQLIIIGDAPGNTNEEIKKKRLHKSETYWKKDPRFADILEGDKLVGEMKARNIAVHSFYIGSGPGKYFQELSKATAGQASEYNVNEPKAADKLTGFIVENVLNKVGGELRGKELVSEYRLRFK